MAFKKKCFYEIFGAVLMLSASLSTASGVDCHGKSFHCVNSTHFMICVDLGGGVSQSIDDFLIPCPPPTICQGSNHFECEFPAPTPLPTLNVISETTQPWEDVVVTTNSPQRKTTKEYSEKYVNTESLTFGDSFTTDATVYTTEAPLSSASIDLNNRINVTETVFTLPESNVYETTTTVDTLTESILMYDTTNKLDLVPQILPENITTEVATEIPLVDIPTVAPPNSVPQTISENITTEAATEIPLVDISAVAPPSLVPQTIHENITTEVATEIPLVDIPTVVPPSPVSQTIFENINTGVATETPLVDISAVAPPSPVPQTISENITTEIPLVDIITVEPPSPVPKTIPENITTEVTTETPLVDISAVAPPSLVPQTIPENITTEVATEIPLLDIPTVAPPSPVSQTIFENITTDEATETPLVDNATVVPPSPVPQTISENITTDEATETPLVDKATVVPPSPVPQTISENITTEVATEIPLGDTITVEPPSPVLQTIPENITTEVTTEISMVDISAVAQPSLVPQIIPENINAEVATEIPLVDTPTVVPPSPVSQTISENITTEAATEIPLVYIPTVVTPSPVPKTISENITTEAATEIPLVDIPTVVPPSPVPQTISENITTEVATETPLVDISVAAPPSPVPQTISENITTEVATETPLVDIPIVAPPNAMPQPKPENSTTEVTTEIPLVDVTTEAPMLKDAAMETTPSTISANDSSLDMNVNVTSVIENTVSTNVNSNTPDNNKQVFSETTINTETFIGSEQNVKISPEKTYSTEVNPLANNQFGFTEELVSNVEQTTASYLAFENTHQPTTIGPEILTTDATVNLATEPSLPYEENPLNQLPTVANTVVALDNVTNKIISNQTPKSAVNNKDETPTGDYYITKRPLIATEHDQGQSIFTDDKAHFTTEHIQSNNTDIVALVKAEKKVSVHNETPKGTSQIMKTQEEKTSTTKNGFNKDNTETKPTKSVTADIPIGKNKNITSLQSNTQKEAIQTIKNQEERKSTTEMGITNTADLPTSVNNKIASSQNKTLNDINQTITNQEEKNSPINETETKLPKATIVDLSTGENNVLANTIFDTVIVPAVGSTESATLTVSDGNFQTVANGIKTEATISVLGTESSVFIDNNNVVTENPYLTTEKDFKNTTTQFAQDQEASVIGNSYLATKQPNTNTFDNAVTTENAIYLPIHILNISTSEGFEQGIQSLHTTTEQPITVTFNEQLQTVVDNNVATEPPIISTINEQVPQSNNENSLNKEKRIFVNNNNVASGDSNSLKVINNTQEAIAKIPQDQVWSFTENEYITHGIMKAEPEIMVVTTESEIYNNGFQNDQSTTVNGITTEGKPSIDSSKATTVEEVIVTTDATVNVNQDKSFPPYDSVTTMVTSVNVPETIDNSVKHIYDKLYTANPSNREDTVTTYNPLEETKKPVPDMFDTSMIQSGLNKEVVSGKISASVVTTDTDTNSDYTTTESNNLSLDTVNQGIREAQMKGSNVKETSSTHAKEIEKTSEMPSGTTQLDYQILTMDNTEVQDVIGTTENKNAINESGLKQTETIRIDGTNAVGLNTQNTKYPSSIPSVPVTDTNTISHTNENNDVLINKHVTNTPTDAIGSSSGKLNTEKIVSSGNTGLELINNNAINLQSQTTLQSINNGTPNVNDSTRYQVNSTQTNIESALGNDTLQDSKTTIESNLSQIGSSGLDTVENNIINQQSQATSQSIDSGIPNVNKNAEESPNSQRNTDIDQVNHNLEQTNVTGVLVTNILQQHDETTTESNQGQIGSSGLDTIENNIVNEISQTTTQSFDMGTSNKLNSIDGSANVQQITSDSKANTITSTSNNDQTTLSDHSAINQQSQIRPETTDRGSSNVLLNIEGNSDATHIVSGSNFPTRIGVNTNHITSDPEMNIIMNQVNQGSEVTNVASISVKGDKTITSETSKVQISESVTGLDVTKNNNEQSQITSEANVKGTSNVLISGTDSKAIEAAAQVNTNKRNQETEVIKAVSASVTNDKTESKTNDQSSSGVNSGFHTPQNNTLSQQSEATSEANDKGSPNVLISVEGKQSISQVINNQFNQVLEQANVVGIEINGVKTTTENNLQQTNISIYLNTTDEKSSNDIQSHANENLHSAGQRENSGLVSESFAIKTTKTVNNPVDSQDVSSSSAPATDSKPKSTVLETVQNVLQTIGNFFNTASNNSSSAIGNTDNQARDESNILPKEITPANIDVTTEQKKTLLDSTLFNNLHVSKVGANVPKLDINIKRGSTESAPVNKHQTDESINIIRQVATIVPFDEASLSNNNDKDQVSHNVTITKPIISQISPGTSESTSNNKVVPVVESVTLNILATETTTSGSSGTIKDSEGHLLSTVNSKVNKIEITADPYKPVTINPATKISTTTTIQNNPIQKSDAPAVPKAEDISFVKQPEHVIPTISEQTFTNGNRPDIGTVLTNTNLNAKPNDNGTGQENTVHGSIPIQGAGSSVINGMNILPSIDITSLFTDSAGKTTGIISGLVSETAQDKAPSKWATTYENNNAGIMNPSNVVAGNINENVSSNINQQNDFPAQQKTPVNAVEKEITQSPIPIHETTSNGTVFSRNNSATVINNISQSATNANVQQNTEVNTTGSSHKPVTVTKKPVNKITSSVQSTTSASAKKTVPKPVSNVTENSKKQIVNSTLNFSCISGIRGRYSDKNDCRKFYICVGTVGNTEPIVGHCPVNTVFSDIKKQCTKNMSHCIRENEFKCPSGGRFSDVIKENVYYICVHHNSHLYRFKFQCQQGFTLNKTTVRCVENKEIESNESVSVSSDNTSDSSSQSASSSSTSSSSTSSISTSSSGSSSGSSSSSTASSSSNTSGDSDSSSSKSKKKKEKSESKDGDDDDDVFECEREGKFRVKDDCKRYYLCKKTRKGQYRRKLKKCESDEVFHKKKRRCVDEDDYEC